jgi:uncharacterized SAM-binding protein YcdF (DUF218 family)
MTYIQPIVCLILAGFVLAALQLRRGKGERWIAVMIVALFAASWPPIAWLIAQPLEGRSPRVAFPNGQADAIVVLSAGIIGKKPEQPYRLPDFDAFRRCEHAAWLFRAWRSVPVLASGGSEKSGAPSMAATMRPYLVRAGVPEEMVWTEERSHSTYDNAVYSAQILHAHGITRIALVVDARSMPRAAACFRKQGITVVPAPCRFIDIANWQDWLPSWKSIGENELTLHETGGLVWYWLRGKI